MKLRSKVRTLIQRNGLHVYRKPPRGADIFFDIARELPQLDVRTVFDVGANIGQSAAEFAEAFPKASIYCFEPVASTHALLCRNTAANPRITSHQIAFSSSQRSDAVSIHGPSSMYRLVSTGSGGEPDRDKASTEVVDVDTIDRFCTNHGIDRINYLKVDTEGSDLEALRGAVNLIRSAGVDIIQVEVGFNCKNKWHIPFDDFNRWLSEFDYELFLIAEQHPSYTPPSPYLSRADAVYIAPHLLAARGNR